MANYGQSEYRLGWLQLHWILGKLQCVYITSCNSWQFVQDTGSPELWKQTVEESILARQDFSSYNNGSHIIELHGLFIQVSTKTGNAIDMRIAWNWIWVGDMMHVPLCISPSSLVVLDHYHTSHSWLAPSQWETSLLCNDVSHWLGASLESALLSGTRNLRIQFVLVTTPCILSEGVAWVVWAFRINWIMDTIVLIINHCLTEMQAWEEYYPAQILTLSVYDMEVQHTSLSYHLFEIISVYFICFKLFIIFFLYLFVCVLVEVLGCVFTSGMLYRLC